jgi:hypothetical protein
MQAENYSTGMESMLLDMSRDTTEEPLLSTEEPLRLRSIERPSVYTEKALLSTKDRYGYGQIQWPLNIPEYFRKTVE